MRNNPYRNAEGYYDPTAGAVLVAMAKKERSDRRKARRKLNQQRRREQKLSSPKISTIFDNSTGAEVSE